MNSFNADALLATLDGLGLPERLLVAFSGGMDSSVLLHALGRLHVAGRVPLVEAIHVDHGLNPASVDWRRHCEDRCRMLGVVLHAVRVEAAPSPGQSPEAAARTARYDAMRSMVGRGDALITAHHRDDQAETLLLQLLRGSGPAGLAAMPEQSAFGEGRLLRPLLQVPRPALRAYAEAEALRWVEDESNSDTRLDRNFLRHEILPRIEQRWPAAVATLARSARLQAEVRELNLALARCDAGERGAGEATLALDRLVGLAPARQRNLLRHWLRGQGLPMPSYRRLEELRRSMLQAGADRAPRVAWEGVEVRRYRGRLHALRPCAAIDWQSDLSWRPDQPLALPGLGKVLIGSSVSGHGVRWDPADGPFRVRWRRGGERCRPAGHLHHHALKKLLQQAGVPPWERGRIPLIYKGHELVAVAGHWYCEPWLVAAGEPGWVFVVQDA